MRKPLATAFIGVMLVAVLTSGATPVSIGMGPW
jgi:hypothetical protein